MSSHQRHMTHVPVVRLEVEKSLGITQRSAPVDFAWTGDIRKRYTDFLVNEITKSGTVLHLYDFPEDGQGSNSLSNTQHKAPQNLTSNGPQPGPAAHNSRPISTASAQDSSSSEIQPVPETDRAVLVGLLGEDCTAKLIELDEKIQGKKWQALKGVSVQFPVIEDRDARRNIHQEVRRIFSSRLNTVADAQGIITASQAKPSNRGGDRNRRDGGRSGPRNQSFEALGGEYLHLTLYKENKDTMDAINTIARLLKVKASTFAFAGTKDRRAATVQRISVSRQRAHNVVWLNSRIPGIKVGDIAHSRESLSLGQHGGNEFVITLKNCLPLDMPDASLDQRLKQIRDAVEKSLAFLRARGYINYYGLQRFGTHAIGTHLLGMKILKGDFQGVVDDILHVDEHLVDQVVSQGGPIDASASTADDLDRARAVTTWKMTKNADAALSLLPKRFSSEMAIIRHLSMPTHHNDYMGAILVITRGMRMMYIHAYQSYIWNHVASLRWSKYGTTVIVGDLVLVDSGARSSDATEDGPFDAAEEDEFYARARHLTEEDIASGKYTIADVVLPTPGFDVIYPKNDIGEFYKEFMAREENGQLNPFEMRRKQREFSLSGNYRSLMGRFLQDPQYCVRTYTNDTEQMYPTDLDIATQKKAQKKAASRKRPLVERTATPPEINAWNHFASNPEEWDNALAAESRRKAENNPPSEGITRVQETWVKTGQDDQDNKRIKITREAFEHIDVASQNKDGKKPMDLVSPVGDVSAASGVTAKLDDGVELQPSLTKAVYGGKPVEGMTSKASGGVQEFADLLRAAEAQDEAPNRTTCGNDPSTVTSDPPKVVEKANTQEETDTKDPLRWFGKSLPNTDATAVGAPAAAADASEPKVDRIHGVPVPSLRSVSGDSVLTLAEGNLSDEGIDKANAGDKIAVVLKFQLKSSNYATVVLRELMGVPPNTSQ